MWRSARQQCSLFNVCTLAALSYLLLTLLTNVNDDVSSAHENGNEAQVPQQDVPQRYRQLMRLRNTVRVQTAAPVTTAAPTLLQVKQRRIDKQEITTANRGGSDRAKGTYAYVFYAVDSHYICYALINAHRLINDVHIDDNIDVVLLVEVATTGT